MNEQDVPKMIDDLQHSENWHTRVHAAQFLAFHRREGLYELLIAALNDVHPEVRSSAIGGLGNLGDRRAVEPLLSLLQYTFERPEAYWAYSSAWSLGRLGDPRAVQPLIKALKHPEVSMQLRASEALGDLEDQNAVLPLVELLSSNVNPVLRTSVAHALGKLADQRAVEPLLTALHTTEYEPAKSQIVEALGKLRDKRVVPALIEILETNDGNVACSAAQALGLIGDPRAVDPLLDVVQHPWGRGWARSWAVQALGEFDEERILEPLISALQDEDVLVRIAAAKGLMHYGDLRALPALDKAKAEDNGFDEDTGETVKWAATRARRYLRHIKHRH